MSKHGSADDQSEDGELRQTPDNAMKLKVPMDIDSGDDELGDMDSLEIKPPQARVVDHKRKKRYHEKSHHKRSDRDKRREERHSHRDRHHRIYEKHKEDERHKHEKHSRKHNKVYKSQYKTNEDPLEGEAGNFVKEIIHLTTGDDKLQVKDKPIDNQLTDEERMEQELRKEKLLEAEREMARLKEQSKAERMRRYMERKNKRSEEEEESPPKKFKNDTLQVVTVSDEENSDDFSDKNVELGEILSDHENEQQKTKSRSRSREKSHSKSSSNEGSVYSGRRSKSVSKSPSKSRSRTRSRSKSKSPSPVNNHKNEEIDADLSPYYPAIQGCRSVEEFKCLNKIAEGTYGVVYRAKDKRTNEIVALKRLKMEKEKEGFPITSLREINNMLIGQHANIVTVREIVVGSNMDKIFIVMDYVEHDLKSLMETMKEKKQSFMPGEIKCLLQQLLQAVAHLHDNWILHRDLKTSNLLFSHKGILKVGDFGLAREYGSPLKPYTPIVVTLWYRAPELLLCSKEYSTPIDMWSVGCIFAEFVLMNALFPGKSEIDQINRIFKELGTPNETIWPGYKSLPAVKKMNIQNYPLGNLRAKFNTLSEIGLGLLIKFLTYDPSQRVTAEEALKHAYFTEPPLAIDPAMFPTWPAKSELGYKRVHGASPKPPSGGREYKRLGGEDDDGGFRIGGGIDLRRGGPGFSLKF